MNEYKKPKTDIELVKRATPMIAGGEQGLKRIMDKKAKELNSKNTSEIITAIVNDYKKSNMDGVEKDYSPFDFAFWAINTIDKT